LPRYAFRESTLRKAIERQDIPRHSKNIKPASEQKSSSKSERSRADAATGIGAACTRADERMAAALGLARGQRHDLKRGTTYSD
jgi:hypothetical protein